MLSKHCLECGVEAHPKLKHPSSLRVEAAVWMAAILVGLVAGVWSAATSSSDSSLSRALQVVTQSSAVEPPAESATAGNRNTQSLQVRFAVWARGLLLDFLRTAWWVLPLPLAFSFWRQFKKRQVCAACGSRRLAPVQVDYGEQPPAM